VLKKVLSFVHLWVGLISGLVVFTVAITGCLYAFEEEARHALHPELYTYSLSDKAKTLDLNKTIDQVDAIEAHTFIKSLVVQNKEGASWQFNLKNKKQVFVNPSSGEICGTLDSEKDFFGWTLKIHRSLALGYAGKWITGISALCFLVLLLSGLYLWWPKHHRFRKSHFTFQKNNSPKRRVLDLHRIPGFYACLVLLVVVVTGLIWSFKWVEKTMYALSFSKPEKKSMIVSKPGDHPDVTALPQLLIAVKRVYPKALRYIVQFGDQPHEAYKIMIETGQKGIIRCYDKVVADRYSGEVLKVQVHEQRSKGDQLKGSNYQIHTGKVLGLFGQCLVFLAGLVAATLPVTGFLYWYRSRKKRSQLFIHSP